VFSVVVGQGCWYGSLIVLAMLLPPSAFGIIAVGTAIITIAMLLIADPIGGPLIIAPELDAGSIRRAILYVALAGGALTLLFVALAAPIAALFLNSSDVAALRLLAIVVALLALRTVPSAILVKYMRFKRLAIVNVTAVIVGSIGGITAAAIGAGVWALVIRLVIYYLLLTMLTWVAAARLFPSARHEGPRPAQLFGSGAGAFLMISAAGVIAWQGDTLIVAASTNTTQLGLYTFAFSLAYMPLFHVSWTVGAVLLSAMAAIRDLEIVRSQAIKAVRLMTLLLLPLLPPAIALAGLIPGLLGHKWNGAVVPFQILVVVGICQAITNTLGEVFAGVGGESLRRRARIDLIWSIGTLAAIAAGVQLAGIEGAAAAHLLTWFCLAAAYTIYCSPAIGIPRRAIIRELRAIGASVLVQASITAATMLGLETAGASAIVAGLLGAGLGAVTFVFALRALAPDLLLEGRTLLSAVITRQPPGAEASVRRRQQLGADIK
jgi:PST family polysaccharide transporter